MSDFKAKMHQFNFSWGSTADPAGAAYITFPDFQLNLEGLFLTGEEGKGGRGRVLSTLHPCSSFHMKF